MANRPRDKLKKIVMILFIDIPVMICLNWVFKRELGCGRSDYDIGGLIMVF